MTQLLASFFFLTALAGCALCLWITIRQDLQLIRRALGYRAAPPVANGGSRKLAASGAKWTRCAAAR